MHPGSRTSRLLLKNQRRGRRRPTRSDCEPSGVVFIRTGWCFYSKGGHRTELGRFLCGKLLCVFAFLPKVLGEGLVKQWVARRLSRCCCACLMLPLTPADCDYLAGPAGRKCEGPTSVWNAEVRTIRGLVGGLLSRWICEINVQQIKDLNQICTICFIRKCPTCSHHF